MTNIQYLDDIAALEALLETSKQRPVWIFKHSLTCGTSAAAWAEFRRFAADPSADGAIFALIEVQTARAVSTALAQRTGVLHQSPQVLLLREAKVAWHASHYQINVNALKKVCAEWPESFWRAFGGVTEDFERPPQRPVTRS